MEKIWKDIPGYENVYQVSNYGEVKSLKFGKERILKPGKNSGGYYYVGLFKNDKKKSIVIHKLVAMAFLNHIPDGMTTIVNHIDNNPSNNFLDNLELVSQRYNASCHKQDVGVSWYKQKNKWFTKIHINKQIHLGYFTNKQDAIDMYQKALNNQHLYQGDAKAFRLALSGLAQHIS